MCRGDGMQNSPKQMVYRQTEQLGLPSEVIGASSIEIMGNRQVLLCGQKGIRRYSEHEIVVDLKECAVKICGNHLGIVSMNGQELLLRGEIDSVGFLR